MPAPLPPSAQAISDQADKLSAQAFVQQGELNADPLVKPYDQDAEPSTPADRNSGLLPPDKSTSQFMQEFLNETGFTKEMDKAKKEVAAVDAGRTAVTESGVTLNYVPIPVKQIPGEPLIVPVNTNAPQPELVGAGV